MDSLYLHGFDVQLIIGVYDWERQAPRTVQLDLDIGLPDHRACLSDNIAETIDYAKVAERIRIFVTQRQFYLIEALAEQISQLILQEFHAAWVKVSATKPGIVPGIARVGVTITRGVPPQAA